MKKEKADGPLDEQVYFILESLDEPMEAKEIGPWAEERTGGRVRIGAGTLYVLLTSLEEQGYVEQSRRLGQKAGYVRTPKGRELLDTERARRGEC